MTRLFRHGATTTSYVGRRWTTLFAAAALLPIGGAIIAVVPANAAVADTASSKFFQCTQAPQTFDITGGITSVTIDAVGGDGGENSGTVVTGNFGAGAEITGTLQVQTNDQLVIGVGCSGADTSGDEDPRGGWGGLGYDGGNGNAADDHLRSSGAGGGATTVELIRDGTTTVILVAAGGGGAGGPSGDPDDLGNGGNASGFAGGDGGSGSFPPFRADGGKAGASTLGPVGERGKGGSEAGGNGGGGGGGVAGGAGGSGNTGTSAGGGGGSGTSLAADALTGVKIAASDENYGVTIGWTPVDEPAPVAHTVVFYGQDGTTISSQTVVDGQPATSPGDPSRAGYRFAGWYTAVDGGAAYDFTTPISDDLALFARWIPVQSSSAAELAESGGSDPLGAVLIGFIAFVTGSAILLASRRRVSTDHRR